jgi:hypothetical protein
MLCVENRLNSNEYIWILENVMLPSVTRVYRDVDFIFQQDNCSIHTALNAIVCFLIAHFSWNFTVVWNIAVDRT